MNKSNKKPWFVIRRVLNLMLEERVLKEIVIHYFLKGNAKSHDSCLPAQNSIEDLPKRGLTDQQPPLGDNMRQPPHHPRGEHCSKMCNL